MQEIRRPSAILADKSEKTGRNYSQPVPAFHPCGFLTVYFIIIRYCS
jgi:hypothetical protein